MASYRTKLDVREYRDNGIDNFFTDNSNKTAYPGQHCKHPLYDAKHAGEGICSFTRTNNVDSTFTIQYAIVCSCSAYNHLAHMLAFLSVKLYMSNKFE